MKIHILIQNKIPSRHLFSSYDVIDSFFKWKPSIFFLDSDSPFNCLNASIIYIRKFLRKKNKVGKNKFYNEQKQVKNCVSKYLKLWN
jgi:hypothetical protein